MSVTIVSHSSPHSHAIIRYTRVCTLIETLIYCELLPKHNVQYQHHSLNDLIVRFANKPRVDDCLVICLSFPRASNILVNLLLITLNLFICNE